MKLLVKKYLNVKTLFLGLFLASLGMYSCRATKYGVPVDRFVDAKEVKTESEDLASN